MKSILAILFTIMVMSTYVPVSRSFSVNNVRASNLLSSKVSSKYFIKQLHMENPEKKWDESAISKVDYFADDDDDAEDDEDQEKKSTPIMPGSSVDMQKKKEKKKGPSIEEVERARGSVSKEKKVKKPKFKLDPETVFFDGPPSVTEVVLPAISIFTVIGIIPFVAAVARQVWVRYKFTSRRISIQSGIGGKTQTEIIYPDVQEIRFAFRGFGASGDMVLFLKDGAKVELRHVPKFQEIYEFVLSKCDADCQQKSMKMPSKAAVTTTL